MKYILLGIVAFISALGSALASLMNPPNPTAYVWIKRNSIDNDFVCEATEITCTNTTGNNCTIRVHINMPGARVEDVCAHRQWSCDAVVLKNQNNTAIFFNPGGGNVFDVSN